MYKMSSDLHSLPVGKLTTQFILNIHPNDYYNRDSYSSDPRDHSGFMLL